MEHDHHVVSGRDNSPHRWIRNETSSMTAPLSGVSGPISTMPTVPSGSVGALVRASRPVPLRRGEASRSLRGCRRFPRGRLQVDQAGVTPLDQLFLRRKLLVRGGCRVNDERSDVSRYSPRGCSRNASTNALPGGKSTDDFERQHRAGSLGGESRLLEPRGARQPGVIHRCHAGVVGEVAATRCALATCRSMRRLRVSSPGR